MIDDGFLPFQFICIQLLHFNSTKVCGIYRPPNSDTTNFLEFIEQLLQMNKSTYDFIIIGDINIPVNKSLEITSEYNSTLLSHGMIVTNTFFTRPSSCNILDHTVTSFLNIEQVVNHTIESDISDHSFIFSKFRFKAKFCARKLIKRNVNYNKINEKFSEYLETASFDTNSPDLTFQQIFKKYNELASKYSVVKEVIVKIKNSNSCPWMTVDLWNLIKAKNRCLRRYKHNPDNTEQKNRLDLLNKKLKTGKALAKRQYFERFFDNLNQKEVWKHLNQFMVNNSASVIQSVIYNDIEYSDLNRIVDIFNQYFVNVSNSIVSPRTSNINSVDLNKYQTIVPNQSSCFFTPTSYNEISNIIITLDNSKGGGYDNIRSLVLKNNIQFFSHLLTELFNLVFLSGVYPDCLKIAKVSPIFKSGNPKSINNYRPISVLSVFDKILEKLIANRMVDFLNKSNFLYAKQYGFRQGTGTDIALTDIADMIYRSFDNQNYISGLFLDLRKAFDCIDHDLLLRKLKIYGFRGLAYNLLASYLHNRSQFVTINGVKSSTLNINCGVPQGSVLGPLLFLIYINDMAQLSLNGQIRMFADDTALFYESKNCNQTMSHMRDDIIKLTDFLNINKIAINFDKTKFVTFHSPRLPHYELPPIQTANGIIERVDNIKYLGVTFDKHMTWDDHINAISNKVSPFICLIRKLSAFVPSHALRKIYFSFIHTRFTYATTTFGSAAKIKLRKLQTIQNKCCKVMYKLPHLFCSAELYQTFASGILPINAIYEMSVLVYVYKCLHNRTTLSNIQFNYVNHCYSTRNSSMLKCPQIRTEFGRKSLTFIGPYLYNNIPDIIKNAENIHKFKKMIKLKLSSVAEEYL